VAVYLLLFVDVYGRRVVQRWGNCAGLRSVVIVDKAEAVPLHPNFEVQNITELMALIPIKCYHTRGCLHGSKTMRPDYWTVQTIFEVTAKIA
jgi:hypothetical protein